MNTVVFLFYMMLGLFQVEGHSSNVASNTSIVKIDSIFVNKGARKMTVFYRKKALKTYNIALGFQPIGHKQCEGDGKTPEGLYYIDGKNPNSTCYKSIGISYPNERDKANAKKLGCSPGGLIRIHGLWPTVREFGANHILTDWTLGCVAVTDEEMEEIYQATAVGTPILLVP